MGQKERGVGARGVMAALATPLLASFLPGADTEGSMHGEARCEEAASRSPPPDMSPDGPSSVPIPHIIHALLARSPTHSPAPSAPSSNGPPYRNKLQFICFANSSTVTSEMFDSYREGRFFCEDRASSRM